MQIFGLNGSENSQLQNNAAKKKFTGVYDNTKDFQFNDFERSQCFRKAPHRCFCQPNYVFVALEP